jgi:hypothetical protein
MPKDILLDEYFDLQFKNGDFVVGESTEQHKALLLLANKGEIRYYPWAGVGLGNFINDEELVGAEQEIQKQFELDGMRITKLRIYENGKLEIDASYEDNSN